MIIIATHVFIKRIPSQKYVQNVNKVDYQEQVDKTNNTTELSLARPEQVGAHKHTQVQRKGDRLEGGD